MGSCWCAISVCQVSVRTFARHLPPGRVSRIMLASCLCKLFLRRRGLSPSAGASPRIQALAPAAFSPRAQNGHVLRTIARAVALDSIQNERLDAEGASDVDIAAQSHPQWKQWKKSLSTVEQTWLRIWGAGERLRLAPEGGGAQLPLADDTCRCGALRGSAKHLFEGMPAFAANPSGHRRGNGSAPGLSFEASRELPASPAGSQLEAHPAVATRVRMQIASCRMGFSIVALGAAVPDASPG